MPQINLLPDGFPATGYVKEAQIVAPHGALPISKTTWWRWVNQGLMPAGIKTGNGTTLFPVAEIRAALERMPKTRGGVNPKRIKQAA